MKSMVDELLLILNIKAEPKETAYTFQTQYVYKPEYKKILPRKSIFKFYKSKCVNKVWIFGDVDAINYINDELKLYK